MSPVPTNRTNMWPNLGLFLFNQTLRENRSKACLQVLRFFIYPLFAGGKIHLHVSNASVFDQEKVRSQVESAPMRQGLQPSNEHGTRESSTCNLAPSCSVLVGSPRHMIFFFSLVIMSMAIRTLRASYTRLETIYAQHLRSVCMWKHDGVDLRISHRTVVYSSRHMLGPRLRPSQLPQQQLQIVDGKRFE